MVGVALTTEGECGLDMELQRATRGFHSPHAPDNHTFSSNESLWISKQNDPNEARAQLITLRRSVLKLTGDVLNDDPARSAAAAHCRTPEMCSCKSCRSVMRRGGRAGVVVAVTPTIEKLSVWEFDGKHGWKKPAGYSQPRQQSYQPDDAFCPALYREGFFAKLIDNHRSHHV
ncbi:phosphopantetheinyl transferase [Escherichia coli]|uniref:Phosphopantetheinyl transferase n=1 Tax=Escherichia coli TaxID=562 RepID=A0A2X3KJ98_ECOLX|nr:phosphopantetheinyl transferase [Escherichia coli]